MSWHFFCLVRWVFSTPYGQYLISGEQRYFSHSVSLRETTSLQVWMTQDVRNYIRYYMKEENMWTQEETEGVEWRERNGEMEKGQQMEGGE